MVTEVTLAWSSICLSLINTKCQVLAVSVLGIDRIFVTICCVAGRGKA